MNTKEVNFVFLCLVHYKGWVGGSVGGQKTLKSEIEGLTLFLSRLKILPVIGLKKTVFRPL